MNARRLRGARHIIGPITPVVRPISAATGHPVAYHAPTASTAPRPNMARVSVRRGRQLDTRRPRPELAQSGLLLAHGPLLRAENHREQADARQRSEQDGSQRNHVGLSGAFYGRLAAGWRLGGGGPRLGRAALRRGLGPLRLPRRRRGRARVGRLDGRALRDRPRTIGTSPVGRARRLRRPGWLWLLAGPGLLAGWLRLRPGWGWLWLLAGTGRLRLRPGWGWLWLLAGTGLLRLRPGWGWLWLLAGTGLLRLRPGWGWLWLRPGWGWLWLLAGLGLRLLGLGLRLHLPRAVRLAQLRGVEPGRHEPGQRLAVGLEGRRVDGHPVGTRSEHLRGDHPLRPRS